MSDTSADDDDFDGSADSDANADSDELDNSDGMVVCFSLQLTRLFKNYMSSEPQKHETNIESRPHYAGTISCENRLSAAEKLRAFSSSSSLQAFHWKTESIMWHEFT